MPRAKGGYRYFGGKAFRHYSSPWNQIQVENVKQNLQRQGYLVRVTKENGLFDVWRRKKPKTKKKRKKRK